MFSVVTKNPVAVDSLDHISPMGAARDNSALPEFNEKVLEIVAIRPMRLLDIGCAGGALVKSFIDMGQIAIGIEGSDYNKLHRRHEWATIPKNLFTADATKPFTVMEDGSAVKFDVVTTWEFFEHIHWNDLEVVMDNIQRHLKPGGLLIGSINTLTSGHARYHQTVKPAEWWIDTLEKCGFVYRLDLWNVIDPYWVRKCRGSFCIVMQGG